MEIKQNESWLSDQTKLPRVSFIIPMYNEVDNIGKCLQSILSQDYPQDMIEIHVVDGASEDGSAELVRNKYISLDTPVFLHFNPEKKTAISLNIGIKYSSGDIIVILGAHSEVLPDFLKWNIENLRRPGVYCSGGTLINVGKSVQQCSIGAAMSHWFGLPTAPYRYRREPGYVNTVVYGAYRREIFDDIGFFEEKGMISEDAELNWRVLESGNKVYYDPRIRTRYYPRKNFLLLLKQMFNYGILRSQVFRKHGGGLLWLHFIPSTVLLILLFLGILSIFTSLASIILVTFILIYLMAALASAFHAKQTQRKGAVLLIFITFIIMHLSWALGFLVGLVRLKPRFQ